MYPRTHFYEQLKYEQLKYEQLKYEQLKKLVDAGFGKRIMFGSDQIIWPGVIEPCIATVAEAPFLSEEQKRDILCRNAVRFLRLEGKNCD